MLLYLWYSSILSNVLCLLTYETYPNERTMIYSFHVYNAIKTSSDTDKLTAQKKPAYFTQENPIQAMAPLKMSATIAGYELAVGK